jgi:hypothetical protein
MEIIITMSWCIWKEKNKWIFNEEDPSVLNCIATFKKKFTLVILRGKQSLQADMQSWLLNML